MHDTTHAAQFFARISRELMDGVEEEPNFQRVTERAVEVVEPCDFASISLRRRRRRVETIASTSDDAELCDSLQLELGEGPCLEAVWDEDAYLSESIQDDRRWPRWGPRVAEIGVGSVLSIRLSSSTETIGALNLYSRRAHAFDQDDVDVALIFAAHAANAMNSAQTVTGLQSALQSRHLIGVAQGVLMLMYGLSMDQAFEVLRRYSSHRNVKLVEVAQFVVDNRNLPEGDGAGDVDGEPPAPVSQARPTT